MNHREGGCGPRSINVPDHDEIAPVSGPLPEISRDELRRRLGSPSLILVDVLSHEVFSSGHIPGAIKSPLEEISERAREALPDRNAEIIVYCGKFT